MDRRIEELLPFAINGSLTPEEQRRVDAAAAADPDVAEELRWLKAAKESIRTSERPASPGAMGWARLNRDLRRSRVQSIVSNPWRAGAIAACALIAVQAISIVSLMESRDALITAGETQQAEPGTLVQVTFAPDAREGDIRALLLEVHGVITDGPSPLGIYTIRFADKAAASAAVETLRMRAEIVEFAEVK
jgi:hypothetical protein